MREAAGLRTKTLSLVNQVLDGDCSVRLVFSRQDYCMILLDLKDLFFQAPFIRTVEKGFLRAFTSSGTLQFRVLCFVLTTVPRVFSVATQDELSSGTPRVSWDLSPRRCFSPGSVLLPGLLWLLDKILLRVGCSCTVLPPFLMF